jgi:hypothetical protein
MQEDLQYPIGQYEVKPFSEKLKEEWLADIQFLPHVMESLVQDLDEAHLNMPYREGGWTIHQLIHHMADSHMNAYTRFKLGFTEDDPVIKPYDEKAWANLADVNILPVNLSLTLLFALHQRWYHFLVAFDRADWERTVFHPEQKKKFTLWELLGMYAWHGRHHAAHIRNLRERLSI